MPTPQSNSAEPVYRVYFALAQTFLLDPISGLGGKLLYAGEIDPDTRSLLYAANIAGAASLAVSSDPAALRLAMRDGVIDFYVNSLEEALRILKNEIRKRQAVSVGVAADPNRLVDQMLDRGLLPDLLPRDDGLNPEQRGKFLSQGSIQIIEAAILSGSQYVSWQVDRDFARWLPRLDECAKAALSSEDHLRERWLRLVPRYLGRLAQRQRSVAFTEEEFAKFQSLINEKLAQAEETPKVAIEKLDF
jgi:urocanase-like protein